MLDIVRRASSFEILRVGDRAFAALAVRIRESDRGNRDALTIILSSQDRGVTWTALPYRLSLGSNLLSGGFGIWPPETPVGFSYENQVRLDFRAYTLPLDYSPFRNYQWSAYFKARRMKWFLKRSKTLLDRREDWLPPEGVVWLEVPELNHLLCQLNINASSCPVLSRWFLK